MILYDLLKRFLIKLINFTKIRDSWEKMIKSMRLMRSQEKEERKCQVITFYITGSVEYRVLWKGYPKEQATWEPE